MRRHYWIAALVLASIIGCRSTCARKPTCATCPPPGVILAPTPAPVPGGQEIILPSNSPPPGAMLNPAPPAPNFPDLPRSANFPPDDKKIVSVPAAPEVVPAAPEARLETAEFTEAKNRITALKQVSSSVPVASGIREVVAGRIATGGRPSLDELDQLSRAGYRTVVVVGDLPDADRRVYASRQMTSRVADGQSVLGRSEPTYVLVGDPTKLRDWWYRYFREVELSTDEAARIRADRLVAAR